MDSIFFDSNVTYVEGVPKYDRPGSAADLRRVFGELFVNGIFPTPSSCLAVSSGVGMKVQVAPGMCCINGAFGWASTAQTIDMPPADLNLLRRDVVALRFSLENSKRNIELIVIKGVASSVGTVPTLSRTADVFDLGLAIVEIPAKSTTITASKITDTRMDISKCGFVTGAITQLNTTALFNQLQAIILENKAYYSNNFNAWFNAIKEVVNSNAAGNLYTRLEALPKIIISTSNTMPPVENGTILIWAG